MALPFTLGTIVNRCRQRFQGEGDELVDPTEMKAIIWEYYAEMHALIVEKGARYFQTEVPIVANGSPTYPLPANHLTTIGIDAFQSGSTGARRPVYGPIMPQERTRLMGLTGEAVFYGFEGSSIALYPVPPSGTFSHVYDPQPVDLSVAADSLSVDFINIWGYRMVLWGVASVAQHKGSESQERAIVEHAKATAQLEYWACLEALTQPSYRVPDELMGDGGLYLGPGGYLVSPP